MAVRRLIGVAVVPTAGQLGAAHGALGTADEVVRDRRTLYRALAAHLGSPLASASAEVIDNPLVRGGLGAAFAGASDPPPADGADPTSLVAPGCAARVGRHIVRMASTAAAPTLLAPALATVHRTLRDHGDTVADTLVVTGRRCRPPFAMLLAGIGLLDRAVPGMVDDLLPHVALFVVTDRERSGRLGSASERDHPGMIVLPEPATAEEVAEAVVHEGAHQRFFDLAITHEILADGHWNGPTFRPSWAAPASPPWPVEQTFAAWHAYLHLAVLATHAAGAAMAQGSLLPCAAVRAAEIAEGLAQRGRWLGADGRALLAELSGLAPVGRPSSGVGSDGPVTAVHRSGERSLVIRAGSPPSLAWTRAEIGSQPR